MVRLIILLTLLVGVLYSLHVLVKDYQALSAARFFRLFKRDLGSHNYTKPVVRWRTILRHDPIQCARYVYCELGAGASNELRDGLIFMLTLEPSVEDTLAHAAFKEAFHLGQSAPDRCQQEYYLCPFDSSLLFNVIKYLLRHPQI